MGYKFKEADDKKSAHWYVNFKHPVTGKNVNYYYSISKYGKYAEDVAKYSYENKIKILNWFEEKDDYMIIHWYQNSSDTYFEILIDKDDYDKIKNFYWHVDKNCQEYYARTNTGGKQKFMHRIIMGDPKDLVIDHIEGNGLDNRKSNLRAVTDKENSRNRHNSYGTSNTVGIHKWIRNDGVEYWCASWMDENNKAKTKKFNINKYGESKAFDLAVKYRNSKVDDLYRNKED